MRKKDRRLSSYIFDFVFLAILFICFIYIFLTGQKLMSLAINVSQYTLDQYSAILSNVVDVKLEIARNMSTENSIRDRNLIMKNDASSIEDKLLPMAETIRLEKIERVFIIGLDGKGTSNFGESVDFSEYSFFNESYEMITSGRQVVIELKNGVVENKEVFSTLYPIYSNELSYEIIGIIYVSYPLTILNDIIMTMPLLSEHSHGIILNTDKSSEVKIIAGHYKNEIETFLANPEPLTQDDPLYQLSKLAHSILNSDNVYIDSAIQVDKYLILHKNIVTTPWILFLSESKNDVFGSVNIFLLSIPLIIFIFILGTVFSVILYFRRLKTNLDTEKSKALTAIELANLIEISISTDGFIKRVNKVFLHSTGYTEEEIVGVHISNIVISYLKDDFMQKISDFVNGSYIYNMDIPIIKKDGSELFLLWNSNIVSLNANNDTYEILAVNITELKEYEKSIKNLAYYNRLTGLPNRTYLRKHIKGLMSKKVGIALVFIDFDNFKNINEILGHSKGDEVILEGKRRIESLQKSVPFKVFLSRVGGDEFMAILSDVKDFGQIGDYANKILNVIMEDFIINDTKINITCSIGISLYPEDGEHYGDLFSKAEIAMNKAKDKGGERIVFFNTEMKNEIEAAMLLENDLKEAIRNKEFVLYYQPQYSLKTGKLYGYEALIRWISPKRGFVSPDEFIPIAERKQLIIPIGQWVMREAARFLKELEQQGITDISISINVSTPQILRDDFVSTSLSILKEEQVDFNTIKFELTESIMLDSIDVNLVKIKELNQNGIRFALDDFGTGYSSLTYLTKIPIQILKIDKSFVDTILEEGDEKKAIISTLIDLAHNINVEVVAEGVEEKLQLDWLISKGCNICQGYYTGRPVPKKEALQLLNNNIFT